LIEKERRDDQLRGKDFIFLDTFGLCFWPRVRYSRRSTHFRITLATHARGRLQAPKSQPNMLRVQAAYTSSFPSKDKSYSRTVKVSTTV
jgi:hypothetical protein